MANLIVTVIAIALVAVAALMGAYYGGSAFLRGTVRANAATMVNQGSQVAAGYVLYSNDNAGVPPASVTAMVTGIGGRTYLTEAPQIPANVLTSSSLWNLTFIKGTAGPGVMTYAIIDNHDVCAQINREARNLATDAAAETLIPSVAADVTLATVGSTNRTLPTNDVSTDYTSWFSQSRYGCISTKHNGSSTAESVAPFAVYYKVQ